MPDSYPYPTAPLHWYEGLYLQPHHLQTFQRVVLHQISKQPEIHGPFPYGVIEARLSEGALAEGRVQFDALQLVLPESGAVFRFPQDAELSSLDVRTAFREQPGGFRVGLAVPVWRAERANTAPFGRPGGELEERRYRAHERDVKDENEGEFDEPVQFLRLNGRLIFENERRPGMEFIPLVRIIPTSSKNNATERIADPHFVPATVLLCGSPVLYTLVRDLAGVATGVQNRVGDQMAASGFDLRSLQGSQFEAFNRLRCVARGASLLKSLTDDDPRRNGCRGRVPTYEAYLALQDFLAELSSMYPARLYPTNLHANNRGFAWEPYDHDDPYPAFADLDAKIRAFLHPRGKNFRSTSFVLDRGHFFADIPAGFFADITGCYLCIETDVETTELPRLVETRDQFKLLPASYVEDLAIGGLRLREERNVPSDLPVDRNQYFFRVDIADSLALIWDQFQREPRAVVHFKDSNHARFRLTLYVTLPEPAAKPV